MSQNGVGHFGGCSGPAREGCWKGHAWGPGCGSPGWPGQEDKRGRPGLHQELTTREHPQPSPKLNPKVPVRSLIDRDHLPAQGEVCNSSDFNVSPDALPASSRQLSALRSGSNSASRGFSRPGLGRAAAFSAEHRREHFPREQLYFQEKNKSHGYLPHTLSRGRATGGPRTALSLEGRETAPWCVPWPKGCESKKGGWWRVSVCKEGIPRALGWHLCSLGNQPPAKRNAIPWGAFRTERKRC